MNATSHPPAAAPLVDVILPAYNGSQVIRTALESALSQDVPLRVIVVDDGSTDDSAAIARSHGPRVQVISQANRGVSGARNTGLAAASAPYVAFLDQDDVWRPGKIARQLALIEAHPDVGIVFTDMLLARPNGDVVEDGFLNTTKAYAALTRTPLGSKAYLLPLELGYAVVNFNFISPSTALVRRNALQDIGGFDEAFRLCDDADCWMRLLRRWRGIAIEENLVLSLVWEGNASRKWAELIRERIRLGEKAAKHPELFPIGAADHFRSERPLSLYRLGVVALNGGDARQAREWFSASFDENRRFSTALALALTLLPSALLRPMLRVKRAAGLRWSIGAE